uniref:Frizzled-1 n=1 Tax=Aceria tosichella TaxID=561515 RepID=A0A6G1SAR0_9ACAR
MESTNGINVKQMPSYSCLTTTVAGCGKHLLLRMTPLLALSSVLLLLLFISSIQIKANALTHQAHHLTDDPTNIMINESMVDFPDDEQNRCELMRISFCERVNYNRTMLPNHLGHSTQAEVESVINVYEPLVKLGCSPELRLFLCSVYAPICFDHGHESHLKLQPCQSLCNSTRRACAAPLKKLGLDWPEPLNCTRFPDGRHKDVLCVGNDSHAIDVPTSSDIHDTDLPTRDLGFSCPKNFEVNSYTLHLNGRVYNNCAMPCEDVFLDKNATKTVRLIVGILAIICIISSVFTCATFLIDTKRFEYPARPMIIIAFCQLMVATCYLIGFLTHNRIACNDPVEPPKNLPNLKMIRSITTGNKKGSCTLLFMTLYFFQLSTVLWWLMMTISWYMIAKLKWAPEAVNCVARYFHFTTWTISALLTIYLSVLGDIEGDPLSGTCFTSVSNEESMQSFIIVPVTICLILGCILLAAGFKSIWDSREILRVKFGNQTDEHFKLVIRIGLYSLLFILFTAIYVYSHHYEMSNQSIWKMAWLNRACKSREYSIPCPTKNYTGPHYLMYIIKYTATMAIGMISASFMMSEKTAKAYRDVTAMHHCKIDTR